jgi:hypothetical protein
MPRAGAGSSGSGVSGYLKVKQQTYKDLDKASGETPAVPTPPPAPVPTPTPKPEPKKLSTVTSIMKRILEK